METPLVENITHLPGWRSCMVTPPPPPTLYNQTLTFTCPTFHFCMLHVAKSWMPWHKFAEKPYQCKLTRHPRWMFYLIKTYLFPDICKCVPYLPTFTWRGLCYPLQTLRGFQISWLSLPPTWAMQDGCRDYWIRNNWILKLHISHGIAAVIWWVSTSKKQGEKLSIANDLVNSKADCLHDTLWWMQTWTNQSNWSLPCWVKVVDL